MPGKSLRVLIAFSDTSDLLLLRRILRETPYIAETARTASQALRALCGHQYAAVITDDERLPGMPGGKLLAEAAQVQPGALRLMLARNERMATLEVGARKGAYLVLPRPFFTPGLRAALAEHAEKLAAESPHTAERPRAHRGERSARSAPHRVMQPAARQAPQRVTQAAPYSAPRVTQSMAAPRGHHAQARPTHATSAQRPSHATSAQRPSHSTSAQRPSHSTSAQRPSHSTSAQRSPQSTSAPRASQATSLQRAPHSSAPQRATQRAHADAQRAHADAQRAHADAQRAQREAAQAAPRRSAHTQSAAADPRPPRPTLLGVAARPVGAPPQQQPRPTLLGVAAQQPRPAGAHQPRPTLLGVAAQQPRPTLLGVASQMRAPASDYAPEVPLETRVFPALLDAETLPHEVKLDSPIHRRRMLVTMVEMVESKGGPSAGHGARVSALAAALGREAGLKGSELEMLEEAALLHDVGELAVAAPLLQKSRRLTPAEQRQIHRHVESGVKIARRSGISAAVQLAIRHHHERWDGMGYPDGLSGAAIPLEARIIAVADTWDALATDRPYREAISSADCMKTLALLGGAQLDPELVGLFLRRRLSELCDWAAPNQHSSLSLLDPV